MTNTVSSDVVRPGPIGGLIGLAALLVALPLVPSEAVAMGGGMLLIFVTLALALVAAIVGWRRGQRVIVSGWVDGGLLLFFLLFTFSSVRALDGGHGRSILNVLWQWIAMGVLWFLVRQWLRCPRLLRGTVAVMLALAAGVAAVGFYQVLVTMPRDRAAFARDPEGSLQAAGIVAPVGSPLRAQYEDRVRSREPLATFALTNSLAGFLVPWFLVALVLLSLQVRKRTGKGQPATVPEMASSGAGPLLGMIGILLLVGACLLVTKSRSGYVAAFVGVIALSVWKEIRSGRRQWLMGIGIGLVLLVSMILLSVQLGLLDVQVLTEARKSLGYRWEYWTSTVALIADHPLCGVGAGNFQDFYARYKLPQASEMVADPHNFLLEIAAIAGLPTLVIWLVTLTVWSWQVIRRGSESADGSREPVVEEKPIVANRKQTERSRSNHQSLSESSHQVARQTAELVPLWPLYVGAVLGVSLAYIAALLMGMLIDGGVWWVGLPVATLVVGLLSPWVRTGHASWSLLSIALLGLAVNLLAAGGIGFAGVALTWWALGAMILNGLELERSLFSQELGGRLLTPLAARLAWGLTAALALLLIGLFTMTMYRPLLLGRVALESGDRAWLGRRAEEAREWYLAAQAADPWSADSWVRLAGWYQRAWNESQREQDWNELLAATAQVEKMHGSSQQICTDVSMLFMAAYRGTDRPQALEQAIVWSRRATVNFPNGALVHARLAWLYHLQGDVEAARSEATTALRLDDLNPHREQKLEKQLEVFDLERVAERTQSAKTPLNARQWMELLAP